MKAPAIKYRTLLLVGLTIAFPTSNALADPTVRTSATASVGLAYERNPFLIDVDNPDAASAQVELAPRVEISTDREVVTIVGNYKRSEYFSKYDGTDAVDISIDGTSRLNARLAVGSSIRFNSAILGGNGGLSLNRGLEPTGLFEPVSGDSSVQSPTGGVGGAGFGSLIDPNELVTDALLTGDIGLIGSRQRRNLLSTGVNVAFRPGPRGTWMLGLNAERTAYPGGGRIAESFRSTGATFGYSLATSETTTLGAQISGSQIDYDDGRQTRIFSPRATFSRRLPRSWSLNIAAGASFIQSNDAAVVSGSDDGTSLTIQIGFCRNGATSSLCLTANRAPGSNGVSGVNTASSVQVSHNIRLNARSSLSSFANYSRNETDRPTVLGDANQKLLVVGTSYNHQINQRLAVYVSAQHRDINYLNASVKPDLSARLGVSASFGRSK